MRKHFQPNCPESPRDSLELRTTSYAVAIGCFLTGEPPNPEYGYMSRHLSWRGMSAATPRTARQSTFPPETIGVRRPAVLTELSDRDLRRLDRRECQPDYWLAEADALEFVERLPKVELFDLVVTSPPYNLGKEYESPQALDSYVRYQEKVVKEIHPRLRRRGNLCWQVGNYVENGTVMPLDIELSPIFKSLNLQLRNRIVWRFGHGMHCQRRFSGRYEVIMWYTKDDEYYFDLDSVRVPAKYPGKRHHRGPKKGQYSGHLLGKNPEDVWDIPNVKSNHVEKTIHPCQFPVGLAERLVLSLAPQGGLVFDPFAGVASSGVAAAIHQRRFWGVDAVRAYVNVGRDRITAALEGRARYRPHDRPIMDPNDAPLSLRERHD